MPVHPRTRGEHIVRGRRRCRGSGSSPHTRGTSTRHDAGTDAHRFIPAHAGNIACYHVKCANGIGSSPHTRGTLQLRSGRSCLEPVHPRTRGEHRLHTASGQRHRPVHPRTRGEHASSDSAGNAAIGSSPHVRGTFICISVGRSHACGSSPHVRGTSTPSWRNAAMHRFIPARAGNMFIQMSGAAAAVRFIPARAGNIVSDAPTYRVLRFIPARAGNMRPASLAPVHASVHPRTCGEHAVNGRVGFPGTAVHPRTCGEHSAGCESDVAELRFIPARAGNIS